MKKRRIIMELELAKIVTSEIKVRSGLLKSIQERGILYPILVTQVNDLYIILDGRRRAAAARKLEMTTVPVVVIEGGPEITILTHATRSENPVAELGAIQALLSEGMSEKEVAQAGYSRLGRIQRLARLNHLIKPLAEKVDEGVIAPGVAFEVAALPAEVQRKLLKEDKITCEVVRKAKTVHREETQIPSLGALLDEVVKQTPPASFNDVLNCLSEITLGHILEDLPQRPEYDLWRKRLSSLFERVTERVVV
jgi:ParB/RepB/Spo0J family partition protein